MKPTKKLTVSALYVAMFLVVIGATAGFSFGAVQIRIANALYAVPYLFPFLILPTGLAVVLSNLLFGGLGLPDMIAGFLAGTVTTLLVVLIKRFRLPKRFIIIPIIMAPALIVPTFIAPILGMPYSALAVSIGLGQAVPAIVGYLLVEALDGKLEEIK